MNLYDTYVMLAAMEERTPRHTFLRDRYFNTHVTFPSQEVLIDYKDDMGNRLAPFVLPRTGGVPIAREGFKTYTLTAPLVAPMRNLSVDDLKQRAIGESLFSGNTAASREAAYLADDMRTLEEAIQNREEYMAAQLLLNNGYTARQYGEKYGSGEYVDEEIKFYEGASNPSVYVPSPPWSTTSTKILDDIAAMAYMNTKRGYPMTDLIVAANVADVILSNEPILKLLDNRRFELTNRVSPEELGNGAVHIAELNAKGHRVNIFSYVGEYTDETGKVQKFIPDDYVVMTAPGIGRIAYGCINWFEKGTGEAVTFEADRVPRTEVDEHGSTRSLTMYSRPLVVPSYPNPAVSAKVL